MRPLFHPSMDEVTVEAILHALADPVRAAMYAEILGTDCARSCSSLSSVSETPVPKSTLSEHFRVLREAGLIRSERRGVELQNTSRSAEIEGRFPGLIRAILTAHKSQLQAASRGSRKRPAQAVRR